MFLMRVLEAVMAGGVVLGALAVWRACSASSSRSLRVLRSVIVVIAALGVAGFLGAAALKVSLRAALVPDAMVSAASVLLYVPIVGGIIVLACSWVLTLVRLGVPRFRTRSTWSLKYNAVALTVCVALLITSLELPFEARRLLTPEQRAAELDRSLRAVADGDSTIPPDRWDPDYVVKMLGRDPQKLFRWVQHSTYWIPYQGLLRGPIGVLEDRQGNNLDRALLLATLLEKAGQTVRLAHGDISRQDAAAMLSELVADRAIFFASDESPREPVDVRLAAAQYGLDRGAIEQTLNAQQKAADRISAQLDTRVAEQTKRLLQSAKPSNPDREWGKRFDAALSSLCEHWWVQVQDGSRWVDLDLLVGDGSRSIALSKPKETFLAKDISGDLYHQIVIRVIAEQWSGGTVKESTSLEHILRPADVIGQPIILQFVPFDWLQESATVMQPAMDIRKEAVRQNAWAATLMVGRDDVASGTLYDTGENPGSQKGGAFTFGDSLSETLKQKRGGSNKILSAVWMEYEIRVPGEKPRTIRRTVFDLLGPAARVSASGRFQLDEAKRLTRALSLDMKTEILPMVCQFAPEFVAHLTAEPFNADQELLSSMLKPGFSADSEKTKQLLAKAKPPVSPLVALAFTRLEWNHLSEKVFIDRPNILTRHQYLTATSKGIALHNAIDIVANEVGVNLASPDAFSVRLQQGVRDTNSEAFLYGGGGTGNTADAFADSSNWLTVTPAQHAAIQDLSLAEDTRRGMTQEVDAGYLLVATKSPVHRRDEEFVGWWRINPETGDTLGIAENGWGQDLPEEAVIIHAIMRFAQAFLWENVACHAFAQAFNAIVVIKELLVGDWHPSWTGPSAQSQDPSDVYKESKTVCLIQAIVMGFASTVPMLMMLRNNRRLSALRALEDEEAVAANKPPRNPCPDMMMVPFASDLRVATLFLPSWTGMLIAGGPCVPGGGPGPGGGEPEGSAGKGPRDTQPDPNVTQYDPDARPPEPPEPEPRPKPQNQAEAQKKIDEARQKYADAKGRELNALNEIGAQNELAASGKTAGAPPPGGWAANGYGPDNPPPIRYGSDDPTVREALVNELNQAEKAANAAWNDLQEAQRDLNRSKGYGGLQSAGGSGSSAVGGAGVSNALGSGGNSGGGSGKP